LPKCLNVFILSEKIIDGMPLLPQKRLRANKKVLG